MKAFFCPMFCDLWEHIAFWKVPRLYPVFILVRMHRWKWEWTTVGTTLTGKIEIFGEKCVPVPNKHSKQGWLTKGIKISCQHKRDLYMLCKDTNNSKIKNYYKTYWKVLSKVIKTAKRHHFNNLIKRSKNKTKTMWNIVKAETNTRDSKDKLLLKVNP